MQFFQCILPMAKYVFIQDTIFVFITSHVLGLQFDIWVYQLVILFLEFHLEWLMGVR